jgi:hypothetical protein
MNFRRNIAIPKKGGGVCQKQGGVALASPSVAMSPLKRFFAAPFFFWYLGLDPIRVRFWVLGRRLRLLALFSVCFLDADSEGYVFVLCFTAELVV